MIQSNSFNAGQSHSHFVHFFIVLGKTETPGASESLHAIQQRGFLDEIAPALRESGLRSNMTAHRDLTGSSLTEAILRDVEELGRLLDSDFVGNP